MTATNGKNRPILRFVESMQLAAGQLDREACKVSGVKIIGTESLNGRIYPIDVLKRAIPLYEGVRVYFDHLNESTPNRSVTTLFGSVEKIHAGSDGLYGDLVYNPKHLYAEQVLYQIEHAPDKLGLSPHHAGIVETVNGKNTIVEITNVFSVDIVDRPATTDGMFESEDTENIATLEKGTSEMEWEKITLEDLQTNRPDLVKAIQSSIAADLQAQNDLLSVAIEDVIKAEEPAPVDPEAGTGTGEEKKDEGTV